MTKSTVEVSGRAKQLAQQLQNMDCLKSETNPMVKDSLRSLVAVVADSYLATCRSGAYEAGRVKAWKDAIVVVKKSVNATRFKTFDNTSGEVALDALKSAAKLAALKEGE